MGEAKMESTITNKDKWVFDFDAFEFAFFYRLKYSNDQFKIGCQQNLKHQNITTLRQFSDVFDAKNVIMQVFIFIYIIIFD